MLKSQHYKLITWGELKHIVDALDGLTDQTPIEYVNFSWATTNDFKSGEIAAWLSGSGEDKRLMITRRME